MPTVSPEEFAVRKSCRSGLMPTDNRFVFAVRVLLSSPHETPAPLSHKIIWAAVSAPDPAHPCIPSLIAEDWAVFPHSIAQTEFLPVLQYLTLMHKHIKTSIPSFPAQCLWSMIILGFTGRHTLESRQIMFYKILAGESCFFSFCIFVHVVRVVAVFLLL